MPRGREGEKAFSRADNLLVRRRAACTEKRPEEGGSSFDRQVTDRRGKPPGTHAQGRQQEEFCRQLPAAERNGPRPPG